MAAFEPIRSPRTELDRRWSGYIEQIVAADQGALASLYDASNHLVFGVVLRILGNPADAEEVTLDIYAQLWRTAATFDDRRGRAIAWLMTMARTRAIDKLRSRANRTRREEPIDNMHTAASHPPAEGVTHDVQTALQSLPPEQREAIELSYWYGYSHAELAEHLGQPLGTVKTRIRLGMMKLRSHLGEPA